MMTTSPPSQDSQKTVFEKIKSSTSNEKVNIDAARNIQIEKNIENKKKAEQAEHERRLNKQVIDDKKADRDLKLTVKKNVFVTLWVQMAFMAVIIVLQGFKIGGFQLNEVVFGLLVNVALVQTFFSVRHITNHLFPNHEKLQ